MISGRCRNNHSGLKQNIRNYTATYSAKIRNSAIEPQIQAVTPSIR
jgi:hypothetical protein